MGRLRKHLILVLAPFFTFAMLCTSFAEPSAAALVAQNEVQSWTCEGNRSGDTSTPDLHFLCNSGSSLGSIAGAIAVSSQAREDFFKDKLLIGPIPEGLFHKSTAVGSGSTFGSFIHSARKVSTHLFNSVLTL